jgi:hypothetical protein
MPVSFGRKTLTILASVIAIGFAVSTVDAKPGRGGSSGSQTHPCPRRRQHRAHQLVRPQIRQLCRAAPLRPQLQQHRLPNRQ